MSILYPKKTEKDLYLRLVKQCENYMIKFEDDLNIKEYDLIIDSIFGFSFKGEIRFPFDKIINSLNELKKEEKLIKIASVDIPSGWDVEKGNINNTFTPDLLISLTLPKLGVEKYSGIHYLGGRFVPGKLYNKLGLQQPKYQGSNLILKLH